MAATKLAKAKPLKYPTAIVDMRADNTQSHTFCHSDDSSLILFYRDNKSSFDAWCQVHNKKPKEMYRYWCADGSILYYRRLDDTEVECGCG